MGVCVDLPRHRQARRRERRAHSPGAAEGLGGQQPGRPCDRARCARETDATAEQTDVESFKYLQPAADGFRNYLAHSLPRRAEHLLVDKADFLTLTAPEMTVLVGGMRALGANFDGSQLGVFTKTPGKLTNDFFIEVLDIGTEWTPASADEELFNGRCRKSGQAKWTATRVDLAFGSNSQLRALSEVYGSADAHGKFVCDFVSAWTKVMNLDRFDLA